VKLDKFIGGSISVAAYYVLLSLICNWHFFGYVINNTANPLLRLSLFLLLPAVNFLAAYLLLQLTRVVGKIILAITHIINTICFYYIAVFHTMMDATMLGNVYNTQWSEASGFITLPAILCFLLLGLIPALIPFVKRTIYSSWRQFGIVAGSTLGTILIIILLNLNNLLWIGDHDTELGGLLMPWSYTVNTGRLISQHNAASEHEILLPDAKFINNDKEAVVLVIGESARKANFSLYGYNRQTNPRLSAIRDELTILSCDAADTYTTAGVRAILSPFPSDDLYEILPNYLFRNGVDVSWRTSNWGEPPIHIDEYLDLKALQNLYNSSSEYDELLFMGLADRIRQSKKNKVLIVLHTSTSHGPKYARKYPKEFCRFTPASDDVESTSRNLQHLVNSYDNSILYTDDLLASAIDSLRQLSGWHTYLIYISDHGESLGENNLFMHGVPRKIAPAEQYEIPYIIWSSEPLEERPAEPATQYSVFPTVLRLLHIQSPRHTEH